MNGRNYEKNFVSLLHIWQKKISKTKTLLIAALNKYEYVCGCDNCAQIKRKTSFLITKKYASDYKVLTIFGNLWKKIGILIKTLLYPVYGSFNLNFSRDVKTRLKKNLLFFIFPSTGLIFFYLTSVSLPHRSIL